MKQILSWFYRWVDRLREGFHCSEFTQLVDGRWYCWHSNSASYSKNPSFPPFYQVLSYFFLSWELRAYPLFPSVVLYFISYLFFKFFHVRNFCSLYLKIKGSVSKRFFPFAFQSNCFSELCYTRFFALIALPVFTRILSNGLCHFISKDYIFHWGLFCLGLWFAHLRCWR